MDSIVFFRLKLLRMDYHPHDAGHFRGDGSHSHPCRIGFFGSHYDFACLWNCIRGRRIGGIRKRTRDCACGIFRGDGWIDAIRFFILANETFIGCPQNLNNFHNLINGALPRKNGCLQNKFSYTTSTGPYINCTGIFSSPENKFRGSVGSRRDI